LTHQGEYKEDYKILEKQEKRVEFGWTSLLHDLITNQDPDITRK